MGVINQLEPQSVFRFFEEICSIPHGSGNMDAISQYMVDFAAARGLKCRQDERKNIIMWKVASKGYEHEPVTILQGHMDMVAVKVPGSTKNMETDPLELAVDGDDIYAKETSLGGDDGIAVAYILAILDDENIEHPPLEVIITVDEEIGLSGVSNMDVSMLKGRRMINLDAEIEGTLLTGCAGGIKVESHLPIVREERKGLRCEIALTGLLGGHSGMEIHKGRANANVTMARILHDVGKQLPFSLIYIQGGEKDNVIPRESSAAVVIDPIWETALDAALSREQIFLRHEYEGKENNLTITMRTVGTESCSVWTEESAKTIITFATVAPNGVITMSGALPGLVETSLNMGRMETLETEIITRFAVRSALKSAKEFTADRLTDLTEYMGGHVLLDGDYPPWEFRSESPLRALMQQVYRRMYGKEVNTMIIHAGLECGYLSDKIKGLDCVAMGPDMKDIHTTDERLSISSTRRVWEFLLEVLKTK